MHAQIQDFIFKPNYFDSTLVHPSQTDLPANLSIIPLKEIDHLFDFDTYIYTTIYAIGFWRMHLHHYTPHLQKIDLSYKPVGTDTGHQHDSESIHSIYQLLNYHSQQKEKEQVSL